MNAGLAAGLEPVELLRAGETVEADLLAHVSTLGHPPRVIAVFRRRDLPTGRATHAGALAGRRPGERRHAAPGGGRVRRRHRALSDGCADPTGPKALRASAGAVFRVLLAGFDEVEGRRVALVPRGGALTADADIGPVVLLLGAEREGLPEEVVAPSERVTIEQPGAAESLNVAMAGAIALCEASRRSR